MCLIVMQFIVATFAQSMPMALHLSKYDETSVKCMWYTPGNEDLLQYEAKCQWGESPESLQYSASGNSYSYAAGGFNGSLHEVILHSLAHQHSTYYRCGGMKSGYPEWSSIWHFTLQPRAVPETARREDLKWIGLVADMGLEESTYTRQSLLRNTEANIMDLVVHGGDISYADDYFPGKNNSYVWVQYMQEIQAITASTLYMTCPGNHEAQFNFAAYTNWLSMPTKASDSQSQFFYSFDHAGVHFAMISTEHDFSQGSEQYKWLERDLEKAHLSRHLGVPWIVVVGHRPLYCSSVTLSRRCTEEAPVYRQRIEPLLHRFSVDVYMCGHNHNYERSYPVYNMTVMDKSYVRPQATVYIVNGAAGNKERNDPGFVPDREAPWRAAHGDGVDTGWVRMKATTTEMLFEYHLSRDQRIYDTFTITR